MTDLTGIMQMLRDRHEATMPSASRQTRPIQPDPMTASQKQARATIGARADLPESLLILSKAAMALLKNLMAIQNLLLSP